ncbi:complex I subunit 4 family protein [Azonexus caeni]|jgi:NADH-quinone oxidoreductase subunit M|uniref:complex I subunit 4 family protein n=1 Tax=Azonexus caeni TaxID=266126 RepID=UPI003A8C145B
MSPLFPELPVLSLLVLLPVAAAGLLWLLPARLARPATFVALAAVLALATLALFSYRPETAGFQLMERWPWLTGLGVDWLLAVDGLSVLFLPATALLFLGALTVAGDAGANAPRLFHSLLLLLLAATLGIFCAIDLIVFFVFWEFSLVPVYFLLARWGATAGAPQVAARYVLIMLAGGFPLLLAFVVVGSGGGSFDLTVLLGHPLPLREQRIVLVLMLIGFGLKLPLVPLHTWLPQFALAAPASLSALLLGLKVGAYGLVRFAIPLAPQAAQDWHWLLAGFGTVTLIYGAVGVLAHSNLRVGMAYASICHVGLATLGLSTLSGQGAQGAISLLLSFTVASGGGMLLLECLRQRTGSTDVQALGGAARTMPLLASGVLMCGLAGVGMPGTSSFPAEFLLILATLDRYTGAGMAALFGLAIAAGAFLALYRKAFFGPLTQPAVASASDLRPAEWWVLLALIAMIVGIGVYPAPWLDIVRPSAEAWAAGLQRG